MRIREKLIELISRVIDLEIDIVNQQLNENDNINQLGLNSIEFIKLIVFIEEEFNIEVEDEVLVSNEYASLKVLCDYVNQKLKEAK